MITIDLGIEINKAKSMAVAISAMTEGAILISLAKKNGKYLRKIGEQIKIIINQ